MKRRQVIQVYLTVSLTKRLWMVILLAFMVGTAAFLLTSSLRISVPATLVTALCATGGILWSSYHRHLDDFPTDRNIEVDDPFIFDD